MTLFEVTLGPAPGEVRPRGEIDMATAPQLQEALREAMGSDAPVIVDMAQVTFIDSTAIHVLVSAAQQGTHALMLTNVPDAIERIFKIVGVEWLDGIELRTGV